MINEILYGFWFGNKQTNFPDDMDVKERELVQYLENFKNGRFENKKEFVEFFAETDDWKIFVVGMNIFMSIACHNDFQLLGSYFDKWDEERTRDFLAVVIESLSCQVLPYLLALLETWDETEIGERVSVVICGMIQYEKDYQALFEEMQKTGKWFHEEPYNIKDMKKACKKFVSRHDMNKYYFNGKELFLRDLTKELMSMVMECHAKQKPFGFSRIPSILSNSTGIGCPVYEGVEIDGEVINKVMDYIEEIAKLNQKKGHKYFYNHLIG